VVIVFVVAAVVKVDEVVTVPNDIDTVGGSVEGKRTGAIDAKGTVQSNTSSYSWAFSRRASMNNCR